MQPRITQDKNLNEKLSRPGWPVGMPTRACLGG